MSVLGPRRSSRPSPPPPAALALATTATAAGVVGVNPAEVSYDARPGDSIAVTTTVTTPELPPTPDVVLLVDRTGSMGNAIDNVKANIAERHRRREGEPARRTVRGGAVLRLR